MRAILRGKPYRLTHEKAGFGDELAPLVGTDEFGNRYYEEFNGKNKNLRPFVEFADTGKWFPSAKKIAPAWHGWMHYMYDEVPKKDNFVDPFYRPHRTVEFKTDHPSLAYKPMGHLMNPNREKFLAT